MEEITNFHVGLQRLAVPCLLRGASRPIIKTEIFGGVYWVLLFTETTMQNRDPSEAIIQGYQWESLPKPEP